MRPNVRRWALPALMLACLAVAPPPAAAAVRTGGSPPSTSTAGASGGGTSSLESAAAKAGDTGRAVAMSLIGLGFAVAGTVLVFRRDFKEAAGRVRGRNRGGAARHAGRRERSAQHGRLAVRHGMMEIRSYRRVFDLERRVYSVDRLRLNPSGVPVRGVVYFVAVVIAVLVTSECPAARAGARSGPLVSARSVAPGLAATLMALIRVEGRTFHHAARAAVAVYRARGGGWSVATGRAWPGAGTRTTCSRCPTARSHAFAGCGTRAPERSSLVCRTSGGGARGSRARGWGRRGAAPAGRCRRGERADASPGPQVILLAAGARLRVERRAGPGRLSSVRAPITFIYGNCVFGSGLG